MDAWIVIGTVVILFVAFWRERISPDVAALSGVAFLLVLGILSTDDFLAVFGSSAPITIAMMFIISGALERTGVVRVLGDFLSRAGGQSPFRTMLVIMATIMGASALGNNTPLVILLTPVVIGLAHKLEAAPSKFLIPLSYGAIFGGATTLIGTSTNILMDTVATKSGEPAIRAP